MSLVLARPFDLPRASRYANPAEGAALLPVVFGDHREGGSFGACPTVQIDTVNLRFCAAAHAVEAIDEVLVDDVVQTSGVTTSVSADPESQGIIAMITFTAQPAGVVTWRGRGKQAAGVLITNCVTQLEDALTTFSDWVTADIDQTALAKAKAVVTSQGYETAWVIQDERDVQDWINEMLFNVVGSWRITGSNRLEVRVDNGLGPSLEDVVAHVVARRDCVDGDDGPVMTGDLDHLCNALTLKYRYGWHTGRFAETLATPASAESQSQHGEARKSFELRGHRTTGDVQTWADVVFARQDFLTGVEGAQLRFTVVGPRLAAVTKDDVIGVSWHYGPKREEGHAYRNELARVLSIRHLPMGGGRTEVTAVDTGAYILTGDVAFDGAEAFDAAVPFGGGGRSTEVFT